MTKERLRAWWVRHRPTRKEALVFFILWMVLYLVMVWAVRWAPDPEPEITFNDHGTAIARHSPDEGERTWAEARVPGVGEKLDSSTRSA